MVTFAPMCSLEKVRKATVWNCIKNYHLEPLIGFLACVNPKLPLAKTTPNTMFPEVRRASERASVKEGSAPRDLLLASNLLLLHLLRSLR
jgi:hypothetical protein